MRTWMELPLGSDLIARTIPDAQKHYRLPMLLRAADVWFVERHQAVKKGRLLQRGREH